MTGLRDTDEQALLRESVAKLARSCGHGYYAGKAREDGRTTIRTHGGNGLAYEYGLIDMYGPTRLQRIAPVSREMVLNYVADRSLGLGKGY